VKILFLIPNLKIGGAERIVSLLSRELSKSHEVFIILMEKEIDFPYGGSIYVIGKASGITRRIKTYSSYLKLLRTIGPDVVISLLTRADTLNALIPYGGKRCIWIVNFPAQFNFRGKFILLQHKLKWYTIYKQVDKIFACSKILAYELIKLYKLNTKQVGVLYSPINNDEIRKQMSLPLNEFEASYFGDPTYINVGRLNWRKGQWHLIRAFKEVSRELKGAKLIIIGRGKLEPYLRRLINKLELNDKVTIYGGPNVNPYKLMKQSDVFVFPSIKEGLPVAILEALACGLTVMSSDCLSGPREILAATNHYVYHQLKSPEFADYGILLPVPNGRFYDHIAPLTDVEKTWAEYMIMVAQNKKLMQHYSSVAPLRAMDFDVKRICENLIHLIK
jgi:glycosyltransferase involved in cell wall biosynthesis